MIKVLHYGIDSKLGGIETYLYKLYNNIDSDEFHFDFCMQVVGNHIITRSFLKEEVSFTALLQEVRTLSKTEEN